VRVAEREARVPPLDRAEADDVVDAGLLGSRRALADLAQDDRARLRSLQASMDPSFHAQIDSIRICA